MVLNTETLAMSSPASSVGVAIVTGAARGIGRGIALRLAEDGYDVGINDISSSAEALDALAKEIAKVGRNSCVAIGDVSIAEDVENMVSTVVEKLGQLNVHNLPNEVNVIIRLADVSEWEKMFAINTRGVFLSYKYAALQMIKQGKGGRIIGACSIAGLKAQEWGSYGIRVNAYCPGAIDTPLFYELYGNKENLSEIIENSKKSCALGYKGTPAEIASIVSYLASNEAHFITGKPRSSGVSAFDY
ncbi:hypothetical protein H0H81_008517 [Sphagnurus paluster]|uniref:Uncharacterized protein n=1 Tax=Sphagnurus paluster TaxID=117069 RepID=A0A9P7FU37_9AGAR|nr:hypothetical protein H0H81_008517 [Sphagnurus paluster]